MALTRPPRAPNTGNPATLEADADAFFGWLTFFVNELNEMGYPNIPQRFRVNGTSLSPAQSWEGDTDTGMWRPGANEIAWSTGGSERLRLLSTGARISGELTGSAVQTDNWDDTITRLMKVGAFGLGARDITGENITTLAELNALRGWRMDRIASASASSLGFPSAGSVMTVGYGPNNAAQIFISVLSTSGPHIWFRCFSSDTWSPWQAIFHQKSILGQVSERNGVPEGAIIESNTNANGRYTKYADGSMICVHSLSFRGIGTAQGDGWTSGNITWNFPARFLEAPAISGVVSEISHAWISLGGSSPGVLSVGLAVKRFASTDASGRIIVSATGRWY